MHMYMCINMLVIHVQLLFSFRVVFQLFQLCSSPRLTVRGRPVPSIGQWVPTLPTHNTLMCIWRELWTGGWPLDSRLIKQW